MFVYPGFDPIIFAIGPIAVRWYGLLYVLAFLFAWWLARRRCTTAHSPVDAKEVDDLLFNGMLGVIVGGRVGYCLVYGWEYLIQDPFYLFKITEGGMSFHGGLAGVMIAMWWFGRSRGKTMWQILDFVAPIVPLGLGFGRIGNFINGELWGSETTMPWGVLYDGVVRHPTQLYESALEGFILFAILWWFSAKPRPYMAVSALFLLLYGCFRFFVEFYRIPDAHLGYLALDWVTMGQILSAPMILIGATMLVKAYRSNSREAAA
jgi:phosphatidylglycerol:prolipoprotein diacylglycerol transferase